MSLCSTSTSEVRMTTVQPRDKEEHLRHIRGLFSWNLINFIIFSIIISYYNVKSPHLMVKWLNVDLCWLHNIASCYKYKSKLIVIILHLLIEIAFALIFAECNPEKHTSFLFGLLINLYIWQTSAPYPYTPASRMSNQKVHRINQYTGSTNPYIRSTSLPDLGSTNPSDLFIRQSTEQLIRSNGQLK